MNFYILLKKPNDKINILHQIFIHIVRKKKFFFLDEKNFMRTTKLPICCNNFTSIRRHFAILFSIPSFWPSTSYIPMRFSLVSAHSRQSSGSVILIQCTWEIVVRRDHHRRAKTHRVSRTAIACVSSYRAVRTQ